MTIATRRRRWLIAGLASVAIVVAGAVAWEARYGTWATLHRSANQFEPPEGFVEVDRWDQGTALCVISCNEARVVVLYRVDVDEETACGTMPTAMEKIGTRLPDREIPLGLCSGVHKLPRLNGRGTVGWSVEDAEDLAEDPFHAYDQVRAEASRMDGLAATVVFNSGLD